MVSWTVLLLALHLGSLALPWMVYTRQGPAMAMLAALTLAGAWLWAADRYQPVGFKLGSFALGMVLNVGGVAVSWLLRLM